MIRVKKLSFRASSKTIDKLFELNRISAEVWNECLRLSKQHHLETGKWISQTKLQKLTKGRYPLHSQNIQAVVHKYIWAREGAKEARDSGYLDQRYPYKEKKYFNTKWVDESFKIEDNGVILLSLGNWEGKRQQPLRVKVKEVPEGDIKEIELIYDRGLKLCISYDDGVEKPDNNGTRTAAIDMGEIHSISSIHEEGEGIIITGRKLRSIKRLRNKKIAELQRKMSKCKKGSRQWKRYNRAKQYILSKSNAQLEDGLHKTTKQFVDWCVEQDIKQVVVGDIEGVQRNTSARKKKNRKVRSRKHNQRMSQWQFGKLYDYLKYKLEAKGIEIHKIDESYTTQTCPVCGRRKKCSSRNYKCYCGYKQHRDIHGAINIWSKYIYGEIINTGITLKNLTYLQIA